MTVNYLVGESDDETFLEWISNLAAQHVPAPLRGAAIPVAWLGRTSTDDAQDPTLSLPRQLENSRNALPEGFVIVAWFYDIESGRTMIEHRGKGHAHENLDIAIPRDGGIGDLLAEAKRKDRRFVAVVCESIERVARKAYFSTKIEYELEQSGVALLAADEGISHAAVPALNHGTAPFRNATSTLTRRIKQAIAEWYVLNMLELSWGGLRQHTAQGYNIGKPPYGYRAQRVRHPNKLKANEGRSKHRLVVDELRGPVVSQIFLWRAAEQLGYNDIADRLNREPGRYPPPDPILGAGRRRRVGAWTGTSVRGVLENPKYTGYMVWNRRKRGHADRGTKGQSNPISQWVWSPRPTHEALTTRELFEASRLAGRHRQGSRTDPGINEHPSTKRTYRFRSYVVCGICGRRHYGCHHKGHTYYRCTPDPRAHAHHAWYPDHPRASMVREDDLGQPLDDLLHRALFTALRTTFINQSVEADSNADLTANDDALQSEIDDLQQRQDRLIRELEEFDPTGNATVDKAWRTSIQSRFAEVVVELERRHADLAQLRAAPGPVPTATMLLTELDLGPDDIGRLPDHVQRDLYDALQLKMIYHPADRATVIHLTVPTVVAHAIETHIPSQ
jgi:site-specific DNA recombinase